MSSVLTKILDSTWSPACLLITGRIVSLMLFCKLFDIDYQIIKAPSQFNLFSVGFGIEKLPYLIQVNSASLLLLFVIFAVIIITKLYQAKKFGSDKISPRDATKLMNSKFTGLIKSPFDNFWKLFIWILFLYFLFIYTIINLSLNLIFATTLGIGFLVIIFTTIGFIKVINE